MKKVGILSKEPRLIEILDGILPQFWSESLEILIVEQLSELVMQKPLELIAVFPGVTVGEEDALPTCRLLLLPGAEAYLIGRSEAACVMSYGISSKDSLTLSSLEEDRISIAIQRELVTITGGTVERQELILSSHVGKKPLPILALVGLLLALGIPAEQLSELMASKLTDRKQAGV